MKNHPSKDIIGTNGEELRGKRIVLCITGSVAAVRCSEIARQLMRHGAEIYTVMSDMAQKIIHPYLMEWATGNPVVTVLTGKIEHIELTGNQQKKTDLILFSPTTANTISKIASGIDDTPVTSIAAAAFGLEIPIIIVPAMHVSMYRHPILLENIKKLEKLGVEFIKPRIEGETAKIAETKDIIQAIIHKLNNKRDLIGKKIIVTAGPTLAYIDPIRVITNKSSGKMGIAIVKEALNRGAQVTLISGSKTITPLKNVKTIYAETSEEMNNVVVSELKSEKYDIMIAAAAVSDWTPEKKYNRKISTHNNSELTVKLKPTTKIINEVKKVSPQTFLVTFKAEYNLSDKKLINIAYESLNKVKGDLVAANDVGRKGVGFDVDTNELFIIDKNKNVIHVPLSQKQEVAKQLIDVIVKKLDRKIQ